MSVYSGPGLINDGLVFYYDMDNTDKSWKGAPTTNLLVDPYNYAGVSWNRNAQGLLITDTGLVSPSGSLVKKISEDGNLNLHRRGQSISSSSGQIRRFSIEVLAGERTHMRAWSWSGGDTSQQTFNLLTGIASGTQSPTMINLGQGWWRCEFNVPLENSDTVVFGPSDGIVTSTVSYQGILGYGIYVGKCQLETGSFATPFANGTRSNTQAILNLTGQNTVTATNLTYNSDGTFEFNGSNNGIQIDETSDLSVNQMTISSWNYSSNYNQNGFMFEKTTNGSVNTQYSLFFSGTLIYYRTYGLSSTDLAINTINAGVVNNQWNNVIATYDGTTKKIYVNGKLASSVAVTGTVTQNTTGPAFIGIYGNFGGYPFNGRIAQTKVYNRALTADEVRQNFNAHRARYGI